MLECNVISTLFAHYICLHGYIHFIYLFNPNTKFRDMYTANQDKNTEILIFAHITHPYFEEKCILVIFRSMRPLVASGEKPKAFFS